MRFDLENLPSDTALLHRLVHEMASVVESRDGEIERLQSIIKKLQRAQFGRRSERLDADQFALGLEDLDTDLAAAEADQDPAVAPVPSSDAQPKRKPLPEHLPREDVLLDIAGESCGCCGGVLHAIGESVSEMLDWVPAQLRVVRITRPKYACRTCGTLTQTAAPERPIAGGLATPALLAQVLVSKYCDHTPLYRQSQILARHGVDLGRSTLAGWVGGACWWLEALHDRLCKNVFASEHLFADDTPIPVLDPGRGRTKTGRLWVYAREQRPWNGPEPPAAVYLFAPDRKAERPVAHLAHFKGVLHVDGYAGFERLTGNGDIVLAACWAPPKRCLRVVKLNPQRGAARGRQFVSAKAVDAHLRYLERDGVTRDGEKGQVYSAERDVEDGRSFVERGREDRHQFRFIVSAEDGVELSDPRETTRDLMKQMEADLGTKLDWIAVDHHNTGHPHTHMRRGPVLVSGRFR